MFQPADVGIQKIAKHFIRQKSLEFLVNSHAKQLRNGLTPAQVKFSTSLPVLRDASVRPIVDLYNFLSGSSGREIIKRAWQRCTVKEWNLGEECLSNPRTHAAYREYVRTDKTLRDEIIAKMSSESSDSFSNPGAEALITDENLKEAGPGEDDEGLDTGIPLQSVIHNELGLEIPDVEGQLNRFCVSQETLVVTDGNLTHTSNTENIWAYNDEGTAWGDDLPMDNPVENS
jgi:hypothetical protein